MQILQSRITPVKIKDFILDTFFPISCLSCGKPDEWICEKCLSKIPLKREQVCPICEKATTPDGRVCFNCGKKHSIDGILTAASYKNKLVSGATHYYKYRFIEDLNIPLGNLLAKAFLKSDLPIPDLIIPVPLHKRRLRWRGFNQAGLLAKYLSSNLTPGFKIPIPDNLIIRQKHTPPQMKIKNRARRRKNMQDAFKINSSQRKSIKEKRILLVDDIATTGSTFFECAKVLKKFGAKEVFGIVIARQGS
ncbi:ComF family protein [bacterium]|nr:ComF family protein [bacterium]